MPNFETTTFFDALVGALGLVGGVIGLVSIVIGRRGRLTDDHPLCRRCGFDQTGRPDASNRCAECGADLTQRDAIAIGNRLPRTWLLNFGIILLVVAVSATGVSGLRLAKRFDATPFLPLSWLLNRADSDSSATRKWALTEISRRLFADQLSPSQKSRLVDRILRTHGDLSNGWQGWQELLDQCINRGILSDEQLRRLIRQSFTPVLTTKPKLRRGALMGVDTGSSDRAPYAVWGISELVAQDFMIDGRTVAHMVFEGDAQNAASIRVTSAGPLKNGSSTKFLPDPETIRTLPDGVRSFQVRQRFRVQVTQPRVLQPFEFDESATTRIEIVPADAVVDNFISDPSVGARVQKAFVRVRAFHQAEGVVVGFLIDNLPIALAMEARVVRGDRQLLLDYMQLDPRSYRDWYTPGYIPKDELFNSGTIDVVLTPSRDIADRQTKPATYWGQPIVFRNLQIDAPSVTLVEDPTFRPTIEASAKVRYWSVAGENPRTFRANIDFSNPPLNLTYLLFIRAGTREVSVWRESHNIPANEFTQLWAECKLPADFPAVSKLDFIFRPDPQWESKSKYDAPWGGEIIIHDAPIEVR